MNRTVQSWAAAMVAAAAVLVPLHTASAAPAGNAPSANFEGATVPAGPPGPSAQFAGGQNATVDEYPGIIAGIRAGGARPEGQTCSGTLVAKRKVLIAAHCADAAGEKSFVYGLNDLKDYQGGAGTGFQAAKVVSYKKHPKYVNFDQGYDVAVVTLDKDITLKNGAAFPAFATSADTGSVIGKTGRGFGYGKKDFNDTAKDVTLDKADLPIVDGDSKCQGVGAGFKSATMICAGYQDGRITILPGDSGGPLVVDGKIYGVASWSKADFKWYSVYGRLNNDMGDWVKQEVGDTQNPDHKVSVAPSSLTVEAGQQVSATVTTTAGTGGAENLELSASGLPTGVSAVFQPTSVTAGAKAKLTFDVAATAPSANTTVTVNAKNPAGKNATATVALTVKGSSNPADFSLTAAPGSATVTKGKSVSVGITTKAGSSGPEDITLSSSGVPSGVTASFEPASISTGGSAKLTFTADASATNGTYTVTATGTNAAGKAASTTVSLTVEGGSTGGVTVGTNPASGSCYQGLFVQFTVTASGGTGNLTLGSAGAPAGARVQFGSPTIAQGGSSTVTIFTSFSTPTGDHPVTINATSADGKTGSSTYTLTVSRLGAS